MSEIREERDRQIQAAANLTEGLSIKGLGGVVPFEAEGKLGELYLYYRERHGYARLNLSLDPDEVFLQPAYMAGCPVVEWSAGENFVQTLAYLLENLEKSPFPYKFREIGKGPEDYFTGWGHSPEEGLRDWERSRADFERVHNRPFPARDLDPTPISNDERVWPEPDILPIQVTVPEEWKDSEGKIIPPPRDPDYETSDL